MVRVLLLLVSFNLFAAGGSGHITDLVAPFANFVMFAGILIYTLKDPIRNYFKNNADKVIETFERAQVKKQEADLKLSDAEVKMKNADKEVKEILTKADTDADNFKKDYKQEVVSKIEKLKVDSKNRVEAEKSALINEINNTLVNEVVAKAKHKVGADSTLRNKATSKLLSEIQGWKKRLLQKRTQNHL